MDIKGAATRPRAPNATFRSSGTRRTAWSPSGLSCASIWWPVTTKERPFTRDQRRWVYAWSKKENNYFGFGTDNDIEYTAGYPVINHRTFGRASAPPSASATG